MKPMTETHAKGAASAAERARALSGPLESKAAPGEADASRTGHERASGRMGDEDQDPPTRDRVAALCAGVFFLQAREILGRNGVHVERRWSFGGER